MEDEAPFAAADAAAAARALLSKKLAIGTWYGLSVHVVGIHSQRDQGRCDDVAAAPKSRQPRLHAFKRGNCPASGGKHSSH